MTNDPEPPTPNPESDFLGLSLAGLITLILFFIVMLSYWHQPSDEPTLTASETDPHNSTKKAGRSEQTK